MLQIEMTFTIVNYDNNYVSAKFMGSKISHSFTKQVLNEISLKSKDVQKKIIHTYH
jgi:hypothetical protein